MDLTDAIFKVKSILLATSVFMSSQLFLQFLPILSDILFETSEFRPVFSNARITCATNIELMMICPGGTPVLSWLPTVVRIPKLC